MKQLLKIACTVAVALNLAAAQPARLIDQVYPVFPLPSIDDGTSRSVFDTVLYPIFGDECALEAVTVGIQGWGRISGMNVFGDLEKAQRLEFNGSENFTVVGALVYFEKPAIVGNSAVNCKIYSEHPTTGAPFATKGFSNAVKMSEILFDEETPVLLLFHLPMVWTSISPNQDFLLVSTFQIYMHHGTRWLFYKQYQTAVMVAIVGNYIVME